MAMYLTVQGQQELRERIGRLTNDSASGDELSAWMKMTGVSRLQLIREMLMIPDVLVTPDDRFNPNLFATNQGKHCTQAFGMLLSHPDFRDSIINYLSGEVRGNQREWLKQFCSGLPAPALHNLLVMTPTPKALAKMRGWPLLKQQVLPLVPEDMKSEIVQEAIKRRQLANLYGLTGWACCKAKAKGATLDKMMASDLGM